MKAANKGYNCKCKSKAANPGSGIVSLDPHDHELACHIRKNILRNTRDTRITLDNDGYRLGVVAN